MESFKFFFFLFLLILCSLQSIHGLRPVRRTVKEHYAKFQQTAKARSMIEENTQREGGRVFYPVRYGADPTGANDSSDAILKAVADAFSVQKGLELLPGVNDLGGVVIDLQGGNYKISKPIRFPPSGGGNVVMQGGTLRASQDFPAPEYLIELWSTYSSRKPQQYNDINALLLDDQQQQQPINNNNAGKNIGVYYEDVTFRDLLFDSSFRGGGLLVVDSVRTRLSNCFFVHFSTAGLRVEGGHETFVSDTFLGQILTVGGDPRERNFSGVAVDLASNDNVLTDVAIFSAAVGVVLRGQANMLTGVHCYNKATFFGGVGILVKLAGLAQTRIDNCYMDYTGIVIEDPVQVHVTNTFFLGDANVVLKSVNGKISGLTIVDNMFAGSQWRTPIVALDESSGTPFENVEQVVIDRNEVLEMKVKSTAAQMTVGGNGRRWEADFSSVLVFPDRITHVQYTLYDRGAAARGSSSGGDWRRRYATVHAVTSVGNNTVVVESKRTADAVVTVSVDQNLRPEEKNLF